MSMMYSSATLSGMYFIRVPVVASRGMSAGDR